MERDDIDTVGVVGAGTMGSGIAQVAAVNGYRVVMRDVEERFVDSGVDAIEKSLDRFVSRGELNQSAAESARERIEGTTDLTALGEADLVVEAVTEALSVKQSVFADLADVCDPETVLATNTSTLSITSIASAVDRPERVVGLHFMNPVPVMAGVEVVVGEQTSRSTADLAHAFAAELEKETWEADDRPGFVVNRVLMPWINEGIRAYDEGVAAKGDVDRGLRLGTNVPMGPLELADHIGLDVVFESSETLHDELGDRYKPAYLLKRKVEAGDLGKKTGSGFYEYD
ncbi:MULTISPECIES: 3-hydroxyacyl-CoA dehydrogenase family protein [Haloarcula]|uniref:3-hydroxyacyl-CoA dehydrogenase family protein n=1 Tax=Haloarcula TaxID=2237 RepID=UPI0023E8A211|nr:3-hydroxyacyl-CoA dehydrogenase NAD-binding domain-containing protein [Halomicroarcula sp. SHR3]